MKRVMSGERHFITISGRDANIPIWEERGRVEGEGLLANMTTRCAGVGETVDGVAERPHGYCVDLDKDGDRVVYRTGTERFPQEKSVVKGWGQAMLGTGKYAGIVASYVVACDMSGPDAGYTAECKGQGSYILP